MIVFEADSALNEVDGGAILPMAFYAIHALKPAVALKGQ
jgi:hypothetical protein